MILKGLSLNGKSSLKNCLLIGKKVKSLLIGASHQIWEILFLLVGKENTQKCVPIPFFTHAFLFLMQMEIAGNFSSRFSIVFLIFHG